MTKYPLTSEMGDAKMKMVEKSQWRNNAGPGVPRWVVLAQNSGYGRIPIRAISCLTDGSVSPAEATFVVC